MTIKVILQSKEDETKSKVVTKTGSNPVDMAEDAVVENPGYRLWYYSIVTWQLP